MVISILPNKYNNIVWVNSYQSYDDFSLHEIAKNNTEPARSLYYSIFSHYWNVSPNVYVETYTYVEKKESMKWD